MALLKISFLFIFLGTSHLFACEQIYTYKINKKDQHFCLSKNEQILLSLSCKKNCLAKKYIESKKLKKIKLKSSKLIHGKNPGTYLCKLTKNKIIKGISKLGHEDYFCEFKDKSLISVQSMLIRHQKLQ